MDPNKVVDLSASRQKAEFQKLLKLPDPEGLFNIPFDDMAQYLDSANESLTDPVVLGPKALAAVKRLFAHFGITETPQTIGELNGALHYCKFLHLQTWTMSKDPEDVELHNRVVLDLAKTHYPELVESLRAYMAKDLAQLQRIAQERLPLSEMAKHYHFELGWLNTESRQRREAGLPVEREE